MTAKSDTHSEPKGLGELGLAVIVAEAGNLSQRVCQPTYP
jgi:hypothetical protein